MRHVKLTPDFSTGTGYSRDVRVGADLGIQIQLMISGILWRELRWYADERLARIFGTMLLRIQIAFILQRSSVVVGA